MQDVHRRVAVVTGAGGLIGPEYCRALVQAGHRVVAIDRDPTALEPLVGNVEASRICDVTDEEAVGLCISGIAEEMGSLDILVTNAGGPGMSRVAAHEMSLRDWNHVMTLNLTSAWITAKHCFPHMSSRGWGRVVNVSSVSAHAAKPDRMVAYIAAKAGVIGLTRALAREWGPFGVTVNAVAPGVVVGAGPRHIHTDEQYAALLETARQQQSLPGSVRPSDVAGTIAFLSSDAAKMVTGQTLSIDGGWILR
jgi:3-oxoacyl-[acyl-carrier protein] reductase